MKTKNRIISMLLAILILAGSIPAMTQTATAISGYNASAAANYALTYAENYNTSFNSYKGRGGDCANFVSQCLQAGGVQESSTWAPYTSAWINCGYFYSYFVETMGCQYISQPSASQLSLGDVMYYNNGAHVCIVSSFSNGTPYVSGHTKDVTYGSWTQGYGTYGVIKMSGSVQPVQKKYYTTNFRLNSGRYTNAYSDVNGSYVGRVYPNDVFTVTRVYTSPAGWLQISCPWNGNGNKTVYVKVSEVSFKATQYVNAYASDRSTKVGRVYPNDLCTNIRMINSTWLSCSCPWGSGSKTVYLKIKEIYGAQPKTYYFDVNGYLDGNGVNLNGIGTFDVYINGSKVANDVTDYYVQHAEGSTYKINDIRAKSGYKYTGSSSYSGTLNGVKAVNLTFQKIKPANTYYSTSFRLKSSRYTNAYDGVNGSYVGRVYPNDVFTVTRVYTNPSGWLQISCPWNNNGNKTVYIKLSEVNFKATKYIQAYASDCSTKAGRVYPNDVCNSIKIINSSWLSCSCPWDNGGYKTVYLKTGEIY